MDMVSSGLNLALASAAQAAEHLNGQPKTELTGIYIYVCVGLLSSTRIGGIVHSSRCVLNKPGIHDKGISKPNCLSIPLVKMDIIV